MHPIYFQFHEQIYTGYTNGHWFFGKPSNYYNPNEFQRFDITRFPIDGLFTPNCPILPPQINEMLLRDWLKTKHCAICNNLQYTICHHCAGQGLTPCHCHCGQAHMIKCPICHGRGQIYCGACKTLRLEHGYIKIAELIVDKALCLDLLCRTQSQTIFVATGTDIVLFRDGAMLMGLMAVVNQSDYEYTVSPVINMVCQLDHEHCWHLDAVAHTETCCWCGNQRPSTKHGNFIKLSPSPVEEFVF